MARRWLVVFLVFLALSCSSRAPSYIPKYVVIFVDFSGSTRGDRGLYLRTLQLVLAGLLPGDRLLIAPITDKTLINFLPITEVTLDEPTPQRWFDNPLVYKHQVASIDLTDAAKLNRASGEIDAAFASDQEAPKTSILASLDIASNLLAAADNRRKQLVILSDMIEDSDEYDFDRLHLTPHEIQQIIDQRRGSNGLPKLSSVTVYIAGASASNGRKFREIENFWLDYLSACGATADNSHYAHSLMNYDD